MKRHNYFIAKASELEILKQKKNMEKYLFSNMKRLVEGKQTPNLDNLFLDHEIYFVQGWSAIDS